MINSVMCTDVHLRKYEFAKWSPHDFHLTRIEWTDDGI